MAASLLGQVVRSILEGNPAEYYGVGGSCKPPFLDAQPLTRFGGKRIDDAMN